MTIRYAILAFVVLLTALPTASPQPGAGNDNFDLVDTDEFRWKVSQRRWKTRLLVEARDLDYQLHARGPPILMTGTRAGCIRKRTARFLSACREKARVRILTILRTATYNSPGPARGGRFYRAETRLGQRRGSAANSLQYGMQWPDH